MKPQIASIKCCAATEMAHSVALHRAPNHPQCEIPTRTRLAVGGDPRLDIGLNRVGRGAGGTSTHRAFNQSGAVKAKGGSVRTEEATR